MRVERATLTEDRLNLLRRADAIVRKLTKESGFDALIWQNPVILIPFGASDNPNSVVLRPIDSVDGMTASAVRMPADLLETMTQELRGIKGIAGVFYDLTNKPPGTIEWE
jgi:GMP synthase (glutamine-hydrolysing)